MPVAGKIAGQRHLSALRDGIILTMPLIIIGSVFLILTSLPIPGYADFMASVFGKEWADKLGYPVNASFDIMAMIAAFAIAYRLAESYGVDALSAGAISIAAFLLATPFEVPFTPDGSTEPIMVGGGIPITLLGSKLICRHADRLVFNRNLSVHYSKKYRLQNARRCAACGKQIICRADSRLYHCASRMAGASSD